VHHLQQIEIGSTLLVFSIIILSLLVHKLKNVFLFTLFGIQLDFYIQFITDKGQCYSNISVWQLVISFLLLGFSAFFSLQNSNSFATIDLAGAYTGLTKENIFISSMIAFFMLYTGPLLYNIAMFKLLARIFYWNIVTTSTLQIPKEYQNCIVSKMLLTWSYVTFTIRAVILWFTCLILCLMKHHLFVWSVFSPKYFYEFMHLGMNILVFSIVHSITYFLWKCLL